jgi:hypothetical protein
MNMKPFIHPIVLFIATVFNFTVTLMSVTAGTPFPLPHLWMFILSIVIAVMCLMWQPYFLRRSGSPDPEITMMLIVGTTFIACALAARYVVVIFIHKDWIKLAVISATALIATGISYYFFARSPRPDRLKNGH